MTTKEISEAPGGEVIVYESPKGEGSVDVRFEDESVWLTQLQMAEVFQSTPENIVMYLHNVFSSKELNVEATTKDFLVVRSEGKRSVRRKIRHYNLDAIISIGYRVNSKRDVRFRQGSTRTMREHLVSGCTMNRRRKIALGHGQGDPDKIELVYRIMGNAFQNIEPLGRNLHDPVSTLSPSLSNETLANMVPNFEKHHIIGHNLRHRRTGTQFVFSAVNHFA